MRQLILLVFIFTKTLSKDHPSNHHNYFHIYYKEFDWTNFKPIINQISRGWRGRRMKHQQLYVGF